MEKMVPSDPGGEFLLYRGEDGTAQVQVRLAEETVWLTQAQIAALYQVTKQNVSLHLRRIFEEEELLPEATVKYCSTVATKGSARWPLVQQRG